MKEYTQGDVVKWTSPSNGKNRTKTGTVVAVVPAGASPLDYVPPLFWLRRPIGRVRAFRSYLVCVKDSTCLLWPRVHQLKKVGQQTVEQQSIKLGQGVDAQVGDVLNLMARDLATLRDLISTKTAAYEQMVLLVVQLRQELAEYKAREILQMERVADGAGS